MMKNAITFLLIITFSNLLSQEIVMKPQFIQNPMDSLTQEIFYRNVDSLLYGTLNGQLKEDLITEKHKELTKSLLLNLVQYESKKDSTEINLKDKQLINLYPIADNQYFLSISYTIQDPQSVPTLYFIINLVATKSSNDKFTFSVPIDYYTRHWKRQKVGNVTYYFRDEINVKRATIFDNKNTMITQKLGLHPEKFDFYMTDHYQEINQLMGYGYSVYTNGKYRDGYGVKDNTIFAIMNNEDFSHDVFHYYSGKINQRKNRNWITEEGIAYLWGNAYYTDPNGEMITHEQLVKELQKYLKVHPNEDLFTLFSNNQSIYPALAKEASVRSTISGIIAKEIESKKGEEGIFKLINAGSENRLESYLKATNELIGINKNNFNEKVMYLLSQY